MEGDGLITSADTLSLSETVISTSDDTTPTKFSSNADSSLEECNTTKPRSVLYQNKYDAFLAHSKIDAEFVESVMDTLEKRGVSCCYSKKDFRPGTSTVTCINEALEKSKYVVCFLSKDFLTSSWCQHERDMALHKAAETSEDIIVPILLDASLEDLPRNMRRFTHIRRDDTDFVKKLFFSLGVPEGHSRPTYSDLEDTVAELKTQNQNREELEAKHKEAITYLGRHCQELQRMLERKDVELKEMKTKLNQNDEQTEVKYSVRQNIPEDLPEVRLGNCVPDNPTVSQNELEESHRLIVPVDIQLPKPKDTCALMKLWISILIGFCLGVVITLIILFLYRHNIFNKL